MSMEPQTQRADETQSKQTAAASRGPKMIETQVVGKIKWFNEKDGYGFITRGNKAQDVFFHYTAISKNAEGQICMVKEQQTVQFDTVEGTKGPKAVNITGPGGVPIQGKSFEVQNKDKQMMGRDKQKEDVQKKTLPTQPAEAKTKATKVSHVRVTTEEHWQPLMDNLVKVKLERERLKQDMEALKTSLERERAAMLAAMRAELDKNLQTMEAELQRELETHEDECKNKVSQQKAQFQEQLEAQMEECKKELNQQEDQFQEQLKAQTARFQKERASKMEKSWMYVFSGVCVVAGFLSAKILTK